MNNENQHTEYKEIWRDEYMKTLAAFANSDGGTMFIGKDDNGNIKGIENSRELLEYLPNKIVQKLNIHPLVKYIETDGLATIEIVVDAYDYAVSYNGKYYIRTGSTTQELADRELQRFLLKKCKLSWENQIADKATLDEIDQNTINHFKKLATKRVKNIENEDTLLILQKLNLVDENQKLRYSAILLFGKNPQKYFASSYFKIGRFATPVDIITDDLIDGNLFTQLTKVLDVLRTKYLRNIIKKETDENWSRIEDWEYPYEAVREAVINTLIHKDYTGAHVQMRIYDNELSLWNSGELMEDLTLEKLRIPHRSVLRNENIANVFYLAGLIEAWGRGTIRIIDECKAAKLPEPRFIHDTKGFEISFCKDIYNQKYLKELGLNERQIKAVEYAKKNHKIKSADFEEIAAISRSTATRELNQLVEKAILVIEGDGKNIVYQLNISNKQPNDENMTRI
jgi:ATP-dependent DNA helicase RecG